MNVAPPSASPSPSAEETAVAGSEEGEPLPRSRAANLLVVYEEEFVERELEREVAALEERNARLALALKALDDEMAAQIGLREEKIIQLSDAAAALLDENSESHDRLRADEDRLEAGLVATRAASDNKINLLSQLVWSKQRGVEAVRDFMLQEHELAAELVALAEDRADRERAFEDRIEALAARREENLCRWQAEKDARNEEADAVLHAKVENEAFLQYHTIENEHTRMSAEISYQAHRIDLLLAANEGMERKKRALAASIKREHEAQYTMARCVRYHNRQHANKLGTSVLTPGSALFTSSVLSPKGGGGTPRMPSLLSNYSR